MIKARIIAYIFHRSLDPLTCPARPPQVNERVPLSGIVSRTPCLRNEVLVGFIPNRATLVTLSSTTNDLALWDFDPLRPIRLVNRFQVSIPDTLPIAISCTAHSHGTVFLASYRSEEEEEGSIHVTRMSLSDDPPWTTRESVPADDALFGGICWSLLPSGYVVFCTATRCYFFHDRRVDSPGTAVWTHGHACTILEVDVFIQDVLKFTPRAFASRILHAKSRVVSILVFVSQEGMLQSLVVQADPCSRQARVSVQSGIVRSIHGATEAVRIWARRRRLTMGHCCEEECPRVDQISVFKTWFANGEKGSISGLVWGYGGYEITQE
jgi:hypothetical protein